MRPSSHTVYRRGAGDGETENETRGGEGARKDMTLARNVPLHAPRSQSMKKESEAHSTKRSRSNPNVQEVTSGQDSAM